MKIISIFLIFTFSSCSFLKKSSIHYPYGLKREILKEDYVEHLDAIISKFITVNKNKIYSYTNKDLGFLQILMEKLSQNNEMIFSKDQNITLYLYDDSRPFYFSFPKGKIFISTGLFKKFLKSEDVLIALLSKEITKSKLMIFHKQQLIPRNNYTIEEIIRISKVSLDENVELNNLTYEILKRSGFDPSAKLLWLQIQNRNTAEFSMVYETPNELGYEEYHLKGYIVQKGEISFDVAEKNSSKSFYKLKEKIEKNYGKK